MMRQYRQPLSKRMQLSARWQQRYRDDPQFRLKWINAQRAAKGQPLATELPPVGEAKRAWAVTRRRDDKGRWLPAMETD